VCLVLADRMVWYDIGVDCFVDESGTCAFGGGGGGARMRG